MKYGVLSDVHANLEALEAVLGDMRSVGVDKVVCLGDVVGYGPNPVECVSELRDLFYVVLKGNHDDAASNLIKIVSMNSCAGEMIGWTLQQLGDASLSFLENLPYRYTAWGRNSKRRLEFSHGDLIVPEDFYYIFPPRLIEESKREEYQKIIDENFKALGKNSLLFVGHSHVPAVYKHSRAPEIVSESRVYNIQEEERAIIGVGSVGWIRVNGGGACYVIYDDELDTAEFRFVKYDSDATAEKIRSLEIDASTRVALLEQLKKKVDIWDMMNPPSEEEGRLILGDMFEEPKEPDKELN